MTKAWGAGIRLAGGVVLVLASGSCGELTREGQSPAYLIITELTGASGAEPDKLGTTLYSDVLTVVDDIPTTFSDVGSVTFVLALKDPGGQTTPTRPTANNFITITRYRVRYVRNDGRNTQPDGRNMPGVEVPHEFDGAMTVTVQSTATAGFEVVRHVAKREAPLAALQRSAVILGAIAEITFYGHDATGRAVSATGTMMVQFGNFGDPE
jgi:hypothetical protein